MKKNVKPLNVLVLAPHPFFQTRGSPIAVKRIVEVLSNHGYKVEMMVYHEGEDIDDPKVKIHRIPSFPGVKNIKPGPSIKKIISDFVMFFYSLKLVKSKRFNLVHAVEESVFMAIIIKKLFGIPLIYDMDSSFVEQLTDKYGFLKGITPLLRGLERVAIRNSLGVIAVCKSLETIAKSQAPEKAVVCLEDISLLNDVENVEEKRSTLGLEGPILMYVGNLEKYQGIELLLEGFKESSTENPSSQLVIIGGEKVDIDRYVKLSEKLGIGERTHFIGQKPVLDLGSYLLQADILVSPRTQGENTPMKIYSYLDSGKPIVATRLPTHTQVLDDKTALLIEPTPRSMAEGFLTLLNDASLREKIGAAAKKRVRNDYSLKEFRKKLLAFYENLEIKLNNDKL
ncbi:MAG: glycosyltransferase family 4 protein [Candidatus Hodarchaeales archaeon]|jgi:glycosyltransferase involved in cell wall biosynthesis